MKHGVGSSDNRIAASRQLEKVVKDHLKKEVHTKRFNVSSTISNGSAIMLRFGSNLTGEDRTTILSCLKGELKERVDRITAAQLGWKNPRVRAFPVPSSKMVEEYHVFVESRKT